MYIDKIYNADCMFFMKEMGNESVNLTLTDIPYNEVNRKDSGLRNLDKVEADILTFNLNDFLNDVYRVTKGTIIIFCGQSQLSEIKNYFQLKQDKGKGTVRQLIWEKTNPSPMNGQYIIWFKKRGGTFNARCKNTIFRYPCGRSKLHPTEKNHNLIKELILDNSNENDIVFDPCCGSGTHCYVAKQQNRRYLGVEIKDEFYNIAINRVS